jgi:hypothetical protein
MLKAEQAGCIPEEKPGLLTRRLVVEAAEPRDSRRESFLEEGNADRRAFINGTIFAALNVRPRLCGQRPRPERCSAGAVIHRR